MKRTVFVLTFIFFAVSLYAQSATETETPEAETTKTKELPNSLKLDFPFIDFPYQETANTVAGNGFLSIFTRPSMNQSLSLVTNLYTGFYFGMNYYYKERENIPIYLLGMIAGHFFLELIPQTYLHEEHHRAVFTHNGIDSSITYSFFGKSYTQPDVNQSSNLYKEKPTEYSRSYAAGIEGQHLLLNNLQRDYVFYRKDPLFEDWIWSPLNFFSYGATHLDTILATQLYIYFSSTSKSITDDTFGVGDPLYWTHTLFQLSWAITDISDEERIYLKNQFWWYFINYLSPMAFGFNNIPLGDSGLKGNFAMSHLLTSFGTDISAKVFLKYEQVNIFFAYHSYLNYEHYFFSIEAELVDCPLNLGKFGVYFSPRFIIGMQPKEQNFKTEEAEFLGLFGLRVDLLVGKHFSPYIDFTVKTKGWVAGIESLDSNANMKVGLALRF